VFGVLIVFPCGRIERRRETLVDGTRIIHPAVRPTRDSRDPRPTPLQVSDVTLSRQVIIRQKRTVYHYTPCNIHGYENVTRHSQDDGGAYAPLCLPRETVFSPFDRLRGLRCRATGTIEYENLGRTINRATFVVCR